MVRNITLKIGGMECPNCAMKLEQMEDNLDGVLSAEASYHKGQVRVAYDEEKVSLEAIRDEITRLGYQVIEER